MEKEKVKKEKKLKKSKSISIQNRKASFEYTFTDSFDSGVVLLGTEIKSIRLGTTSISDAYCYVDKGEVFIKNMHISMVKNVGDNQHDPLRIRKLLLTKREIRKITEELKNQGLTLIPTWLYTNKRGIVKIRIVLAKGKKNFDKRDSIKKKDVARDLKREGL